MIVLEGTFLYTPLPPLLVALPSLGSGAHDARGIFALCICFGSLLGLVPDLALSGGTWRFSGLVTSIDACFGFLKHAISSHD